MRWIVGLDFKDYCNGALTYARWLKGAVPGSSFLGVHVIESRGLSAYNVPSMVDNAQAYNHKLLEQHHAADAFTDVKTIVGEHAEQVLEQAARDYEANALVVGRRAPTRGGRIVALGRVARRLVRKAAGPLVVVPPDLEPSAVDVGPIMVATDLGDSSAAALQFARTLADDLARPLAIVHVTPVYDSLNVYVSAAEWSSVQLEARNTGKERLTAWLAERGIVESDSVRLEVRWGALGPELMAAASDLQAAMVVCGSRRMSATERLFTSSVGVELAAGAPIPVTIVPFDG